VAGAMTLPFAEMVWATTNGDMDTVNRLTEILVSMNTPKDRGKLFKIIRMLYGLMGLEFPGEAALIGKGPDVLEYFIFSFTLDFCEIIKDYTAEQNEWNTERSKKGMVQNKERGKEND